MEPIDKTPDQGADEARPPQTNLPAPSAQSGRPRIDLSTFGALVAIAPVLAFLVYEHIVPVFPSPLVALALNAVGLFGGAYCVVMGIRLRRWIAFLEGMLGVALALFPWLWGAYAYSLGV
jgi:hypothetical protein